MAGRCCFGFLCFDDGVWVWGGWARARELFVCSASALHQQRSTLSLVRARADHANKLATTTTTTRAPAKSARRRQRARRWPMTANDHCCAVVATSTATAIARKTSAYWFVVWVWVLWGCVGVGGRAVGGWGAWFLGVRRFCVSLGSVSARRGASRPARFCFGHPRRSAPGWPGPFGAPAGREQQRHGPASEGCRHRRRGVLAPTIDRPARQDIASVAPGLPARQKKRAANQRPLTSQCRVRHRHAFLWPSRARSAPGWPGFLARRQAGSSRGTTPPARVVNTEAAR